ncbi:MAG: hypothetical protein EA383_16920 [Spirochaetaceae bacterium]|nr:MAG: hypothetical protein EA383_16920 [Spirochaetaceae bacterium]
MHCSHLEPNNYQRCRACFGRSSITRMCFSVLFGAVITHCALVDFAVLQIDVEPAKRYSVVRPESGVTLRFSRAVDRHEVEQLLQVSTASRTVTQRFEWTDAHLTIRPAHDPRPGVVHQLRLEGMIPDERGRVHEVSFVHHLFYESDETATQLVSSEPADGVLDDARSPIELRFSRPMDRDSLEAGISVLPAEALVFEWDSDDTRLSIRPDAGWQSARSYELRVPDPAHGDELRLFFRFDSGAIPLELQSHHFEIAGENPPAAVPVPQGRDALVLEFSEAVDHRELHHAVRLRPHRPTETEQRSDKEIVVRPVQHWDSDTDYTVTVSAGLASRSGNILTRAHEIVFRTQEDQARLAGVTILWSGGSSTQTDIQAADAIAIEPEGPDFLLFAVSSYDRPVEGASDRQALLDQTRIQRLLPEGGLPVVLNQFLWSSDGRELTTAWSGLLPSEYAADPAIYALSIPYQARGEVHELILVHGDSHE